MAFISNKPTLKPLKKPPKICKNSWNTLLWPHTHKPNPKTHKHPVINLKSPKHPENPIAITPITHRLIPMKNR